MVQAAKHTHPVIGQWSYDPKTDALSWSRSAFQIHSLDDNSEISTGLADEIYISEDQGKFSDLLNEAINSKKDFQAILRVQGPDGNIQSIQVTGLVNLDDAGLVNSISGLYQNISADIETLQELNAQARMLTQAEELGNLGHWAIDAKTGELFWSDEVYRIHGQDPSDPIDVEQAINAYHPDDRDMVDAYVTRALEHKESFEFELRLMRKDGIIRYVKSTGMVTLDDDGNVTRVFGVFKDITDHKIIEERLIEAAAQADAGNQAKSKFLASISHELRTPLNAILGFSDLLATQESETLSADQLDNLEQIKKAGGHLADLINDVLDLTQIDAGKIECKKERVELKGLIEECSTLLARSASDNNISITTTIASEHEGLCIVADSLRIKQVVLNLLSNAVKYNKRGGTVVIDVKKRPGEVRITIEDTGIGIKPEHQAHVFEPFNRLTATASDIEGTGIGLTIAKQMVENMGGRIDFDSTPGVGSRFWIDMPIARRDENTNASTQSTRGVDTQALENITGTILYIEDNPVNAALMKKIILSNMPAATYATAMNVDAGMALAKENPPSLFLLDINLPGKSGYDALDEIRADDTLQNAPCFAISASASKDDIAKGIEAGFNRYITKPLDVNMLLDAIVKVL